VRSLLVLLLLMLPTTQSHSQSVDSGQVVLLHGLARTSKSMARLEKYLSARGYRVVNIDYPSRKHRIAELAEMIRQEVVAKTKSGEKIHFITHSMGGIILRFIQQDDPLPNLGRVVMLSPPNQGSEVVDALGNLSLFGFINGPAGREIGTDEQSIPRRLVKIDFELGVITGDRSINWINSLIIPGKDDGKVSIENAKIEGMTDFRVVHVSHPFIMKDEKVVNECLYFLQKGFFSTKTEGRF